MSRAQINKSILRKLVLSKPSSHKGENGRLLIIAGSEKYHGSLLYAVKAASKIVDLIYVLTTKENRKLVEKLKSKTAEFISHSELDSESIFKRSGFRLGGRNDKTYDCVLIGPGMGKSKRTYKLVQEVLKRKIRAVLDADALNVMDLRLKRLLNANHVLTPHAGEFKRLFGIKASADAAKKMAVKYGCVIVLKGRVDVIATPDGRIGLNKTGNEGMTKGGTGDVLAGLIAALYCKNDVFISATAGAYINGLAGDELYEKVGPFFNAEDLIEQIPRTLWKIISNF